jgi:hypothetical protein
MTIVEAVSAAGSCGRLGCWADAISKIGGTIGIFGGGLWTVILYFQTRKKETKTAELTAKQGFLSKRLDFYIEASSCAGVIAGSDNETEVAAARDRFWVLFWGPMSVIEDPEVETAMVNFSEALKKHDRDSLKASAYQLAHTCRDSLKRDWQISDSHTVATSTRD